jgi:hypothetical protein
MKASASLSRRGGAGFVSFLRSFLLNEKKNLSQPKTPYTDNASILFADSNPKNGSTNPYSMANHSFAIFANCERSTSIKRRKEK